MAAISRWLAVAHASAIWLDTRVERIDMSVDAAG
jgi:hypothetical protein